MLIGMKTLAAMAYVFGIAAFGAAFAGQWLFDFSKRATGYVELDLLMGLGAWTWALVVWRAETSPTRR